MADAVAARLRRDLQDRAHRAAEAALQRLPDHHPVRTRCRRRPTSRPRSATPRATLLARGRPRRRHPPARRLRVAARGRRRRAGRARPRRRADRDHRRPSRARSRHGRRCGRASAPTRWVRRRSSTAAGSAPAGVPACGAPTTTRRRPPGRRPPEPRRGGIALMLRIGLIGCGHIGTVHSYALRQLADAGLIDARHHRDLRHRPGAGPQARRAQPRASRPRPWMRCSTRSTSPGSAPGPPATSRRSRPPWPGGSRCSARSRWPRPCADCRRIAELLDQVPHQVGLVLRHAPVFRNAGRDRALRALRHADGARAARRPVLPDPGHVRLDVARVTSTRPAAGR